MREQPRRAGQATLPSRTPSPRVAIFVLAVTGFGLLMIGRTDPAVFEGLRQQVLETLTPVLEAAGGPVRKVRGWSHGVAERNAAFEENQRLKKEIEQLRAEAAEARNNANLVERYRALLNIQIDPKIDYVTARIVGDTGGPFMRTFVANTGAKDGVMVGQGVVDANGLVGRIVTVGQTSSRILLVTDVKSRIPVLLRPSNIHAMLIGDNSSEPTLDYVPNGATAQPGEQVVTSGRGGLLPPNIPIGRVMPTKDGGDLIRIELASELNTLDFVRVMRFSEPIDLEDTGDVPAAVIPSPMAQNPQGQSPATHAAEKTVQERAAVALTAPPLPAPAPPAAGAPQGAPAESIEDGEDRAVDTLTEPEQPAPRPAPNG